MEPGSRGDLGQMRVAHTLPASLSPVLAFTAAAIKQTAVLNIVEPQILSRTILSMIILPFKRQFLQKSIHRARMTHIYL
jgi:hypothetical protein